MNRRVETIIAGRHNRLVTVERRELSAKPANGRRWNRGEIHEAGTIAVADALCPIGGAMIAADVARILKGRTTFPPTLWGDLL
ncbi:MAG: hypothetical protein ACRYGP_28275 [Janthinobacterium lividum]